MNIYKGPCSNLSLHKATVGALKLGLGNRNIIAESGGSPRNIVIDQTHPWTVFKGSLQQISGIICILVSCVACNTHGGLSFVLQQASSLSSDSYVSTIHAWVFFVCVGGL